MNYFFRTSMQAAIEESVFACQTHSACKLFALYSDIKKLNFHLCSSSHKDKTHKLVDAHTDHCNNASFVKSSRPMYLYVINKKWK